jgi:hypothetical protein
VWRGGLAIEDHVADPALADEYADAMRRRHTSLRVTNEPLPDLPMPKSLDANW